MNISSDAICSFCDQFQRKTINFKCMWDLMKKNADAANSTTKNEFNHKTVVAMQNEFRDAFIELRSFYRC